MSLWDNLFEDIDYDHYLQCLGDYLDNLAEGREHRFGTAAAWISLIAHYLDLRDIHEKSLLKWSKNKPTGVLKDPVTITDPETGEAQRPPK